MISRSLFAAVLLASTALAGPPLTTIQDVLYKADGTRFAGTLNISWTSFEAIDRSAITTQVTAVTVTDGNLRVQLVPTTTAVPAANYTVKYSSDGRIQFSETWAVPSSVTPLRVRDVRVASSQTAVSADTSVTTVQESDVVGLIADLGARALKGPGYAAGRVAVVNPTGSLESVTGNPSDCVRVDGSSGACGGAQPAFVDGDSPSGIVDGSNTTFTLSAVPNPASSLAIYRNGVLQKLVQDYNVSGSSVQFVAAAAPQPGDTLLASYRLTGSGGDTGAVQVGMFSPQQIDPAGLTAGQEWLWDGSSYVPGSSVDSTASYSNPSWISSLAWSKMTGVPLTFAPAAHASTHATGNSDPLTPASIGAAPIANPTFPGNVTVGGTTALSAYTTASTGTHSGTETFNGPVVFNGSITGTGLGWGLTGWCSGVITSNATITLQPFGTGSTNACTNVSGASGIPFPRAVTVRNLYVALTGAASGTVGSGVVTVLKNGVNTGITCTLSTGASCNDITHTASFAASDRITMKVQSIAVSGDTLAGITASVEVN